MNHALLAVTLITGLEVLAVGAASAQTAQPTAQPTEWSGFYFGASAGMADPNNDSSETLLFDTNRDGAFSDTVNTSAPANAFSPGFCDGAAIGNAPAAGCTTSEANLALGIRAGYDLQFGPWVVGGLAEYAKANISDDVAGFSTTPASYSFYRDLDYTLAARARAGYAFRRFLAYGTAGAVRGEIDHAFTTTNTANSFTRSGDDANWGYQFGAGAEWAFSPTLSFGLEYLYTRLQDDEYTVAVGRGTAPLTNPFLLVDPTGTDIQRSNDDFDFGAISLTASWRYE